jgi:asparagine synthase (glutamine-hydrolysing)
MSGIVGIVNFNGAPVDRKLMARMTEFMTFRGPDAQHVWVDANVGFGHTLLKTTPESEIEQQPFTLDGQTWIVADARVDAQKELIAKLSDRGEHVARGVTDVELLLRAYRVWNERCVEHLLGDFAFAIWDGVRRRLFCARDHLGVKPFLYANLGSTLIFSNTLDCIRRHPGVSGALNDLAIADFLVFGLNQDLGTTSFADIQRMPPAHRATWCSNGVQMERYWTLPIDEPIFFKRPTDYTDRFNELLDAAVSDRLRTNKVSIFMSGGLDSPTLAAVACKILRRNSPDAELHAFTTLIDRLDGNERHYVYLVANHLGIPLHVRDRSASMIDPDWYDTTIHTPEPVFGPVTLPGDRAEYRTAATRSRVVFYGEGPDNALKYEWKPYLSFLAQRHRFGRMAKDVVSHLIRHRRVPLLPTLPQMFRESREKLKWERRFPEWVNPSLESRLSLRTRWEEQQRSSVESNHPLRPIGYRSFFSPLWPALFGSLDSSNTRVPIETRHPFIDLRMLTFMLAIPAMPWCRVKHIERRAMRGMLPDAVLRRPKSALSSDPIWEAYQTRPLPRLSPVTALKDFVDVRRVPKDAGPDMVRFRANFRPFALNYWLRNLSGQTHLKQEEQKHEFVTTR